MKEIDNQIYVEMMLAILGDELIDKLQAETDDIKSLRTALLYLIYLTQERCTPAGDRFIQALLTQVPALKEYDGQFIYPFLFKKHIKVARLENDDLQVVLNTDFFDTLNDFIEKKGDEGRLLPNDFLAQINRHFNNKWNLQ